MVIESEGLDCNLPFLLILWAAPAIVDDSITEQYPKHWYSHDKHVLWWWSLCCRTNVLLATFLSKFDNSVLLLKDLLSTLLLEGIELHVDWTSGTITTGVFIDIDNFKILKVTSWLFCTITRLPIILMISFFSHSDILHAAPPHGHGHDHWCSSIIDITPTMVYTAPQLIGMQGI